MAALLSNEELDAIAEFHEAARNAASVQAGLLSSILTHNTSCAYLQQHGMDGRSDVRSFKSRIPIVDPDDLHPLIQRIADGDSSALLTSSPITSMLLSSGTSSGRSRLVPATTELRKITFRRFFLSNSIIKRDLSIHVTGKALNFLYAGKLLTTKGGLKAGSSSTHHLRSGTHLDRLPQWTSPLGVVLGPNVRQSMYCHLLCGLLQAPEVTVISSFLAYGITEALRFLEDVWEELCSDISSGTLSHRITDNSVRAATSKFLQRDPQLAEKVHFECVKGWSGIIKRLWPNVIYINTIVTGAMEPYVPYLKSYAGDIPIVCGDYGSSECTVGINLSPMSPPEEVIFTLVPYAAYFEFLPLDQEGDMPIDLMELEVGKEYEVIVTTVAGLYRYRLGDMITITGRALERLKGGTMDLLDFTSHADHTSRPGHYTIFWELKSTACIDDSILKQCCQDLDASFNDPYQRGRAAGTIGPLELCLVKEQTFQSIMDFVLESGASPTQYKTPRCISSVDLLKILRLSVCSIYISSH
ncbi:hypothetical protein GOP47_0007161 [Adiantum capillus-veneris]|uniref:Uncharacterized protein n=1 Tax=Adiantum capillus-veneris TaxID=13818 RepID=A0A9D4V1K9_ADICA|nr:hypothetical protein GOP47_0007161 [Adiantum capillus-veneris]